ncbi:MAG: DUF167 domain-containing protein [Rhodospirillaceae bacterium]|nr:MAG: DUF167 domain-containing protein [Rhodospirillaceae bacterium]
MPQGPLFSADGDGLVLAVKAAPKASRNAIIGIMATPDGQALKVAVTAAPDKGKANAAVAALVAKALHVPKSAVSVISGATDRRKLLRISGDPARLSALAQKWIDQ